MADHDAAPADDGPDPDLRRALDWLPPPGEWRELWFTQHPAAGPVPDEPVLAGLERAVARGWAEGGELLFDFNDDGRAPGARTMRAYRATPRGTRARAMPRG